MELANREQHTVHALATIRMFPCYFGKGIQQGVSDEYISICDIAPTVSTLLGISFPNGCTGQPIRSITE